MKQSIAVGCDPNAAELKNVLIDDLKAAGVDVTDYGSEDVVYANVAIEVAEAVAAGKHDVGLLICGTGIGVSIAANKVKGAYAALVSDAYSAERAAKSNDANIICMGAFTIGREVARTCLKIWMDSEFDWESRSAPKVRRFREYDEKRE
jgi:ribose 5-phosphate isomerase B